MLGKRACERPSGAGHSQGTLSHIFSFLLFLPGCWAIEVELPPHAVTQVNDSRKRIIVPEVDDKRSIVPDHGHVTHVWYNRASKEPRGAGIRELDAGG
jgi:hypothetical protein